MKKKTVRRRTQRLDPLQAAHERLEKELLIDVAAKAMSADSGTYTHGFENIIGVGIGEKMAGDSYTGEQCVTVYVQLLSHRRLEECRLTSWQSVRFALCHIAAVTAPRLEASPSAIIRSPPGRSVA
jgi:hypothetical protein